MKLSNCTVCDWNWALVIRLAKTVEAARISITIEVVSAAERNAPLTPFTVKPP